MEGRGVMEATEVRGRRDGGADVFGGNDRGDVWLTEKERTSSCVLCMYILFIVGSFYNAVVICYHK